MRTKISAVAIAAIAAFLLPGTSYASCKQGFCVSGRDAGNSHIVDFTSSFGNVDHYNVSFQGGQFELGKNQSEFTLSTAGLAPGSVISYSMQACNRNFLGHSSCAVFVNFTHTVR
jgi:hypothetical protein